MATYGTLSPANLYWRKWDGVGDVNAESSWTSAALLDPTNVNSTAKLVSGPSGLYVAYSTGDVNSERFVLRKFNGAGWDASLTISEVGNPRNADLIEDSNGVLHFAWQDGNGALHYRYARTAANADFTRPQTLAGPNGNFPFLKLGVNAAGAGWITWDDNGVQALRIAPGEPPPPVVTPPPYSGPTKTSKTSVGGDRLILTLPKACVKPSQVFTAKLGAKAKKKKGKVKLKIKKVVFFVDGKQVGVDKKKPFQLVIPTTGFAAGSKHTVLAKVSVLVKKKGKKKTVKKTVKGSFSTC